MNLIKLGIIVNTKGIEGEMVIVDAPKNIFLKAGCQLFIGYSENHIENYFLAEDFVGLIGRSSLFLIGIDTKEDAVKLKEMGVFANKEDILKQNENYIFNEDILGCDVFDIDKNKIIGKVIDIWEMPANNVWLVRTIDGDIPLPVIDDVIKDCDLKNNIIKIKMLAGLNELIVR